MKNRTLFYCKRDTHALHVLKLEEFGIFLYNLNDNSVGEIGFLKTKRRLM